MIQPGVSPYPDSFKDQVVKEFNDAFDQLGVSISRAANQTAARHGISRTTVIDWAKRRDAMPSPTRGHGLRQRRRNRLAAQPHQ